MTRARASGQTATLSKPQRARREANYGEMLVCLSPLPSFSGAGKETDDGPLTLTFRTLEIGAKHQEGRGDLTITRQVLDQMARNFALRLSRGYKTPVVLGHPGIGEPTAAKAWEARIKAPAVGYLSKCEARADGLWVTATFRKEFAAEVRVEKDTGHAAYQYNSPSFTTRWVDEFGVDRGAALIDVGILNYPLQEGIGTLMAASAFAFALAAGDASMDPELKKLLDDILTRLAALEDHEKAEADAGGEEAEGGDAMGEMAAALKSYGERLSALEQAAKDAPPKDEAPPAAEAEAEKADLSALRAEIVSLSAQVKDNVSRLQEQVDAATKETKERVEKAHAADCLAFLSQQIDDGKLAPARLPKDWKEKSAAAFDALGFTSLAAAREHFAALPKNAVVNLAAQQSRAGATGTADNTVSDEQWQLSSRRAELVERYGGDEAKARAYYASTLRVMPPEQDADEA